jgi:hypothetical protein
MLPVPSAYIEFPPSFIEHLAHLRHARFGEFRAHEFRAHNTNYPAFRRSPSTALRSAALIFVW